MSEAIGTREFAEKYGVTQATVSKWCREGMGDANYFSRMFRKVEGISPREYRKQW